MILFPNSKINLGLHILQKRPDGFHDIETVFYPVAFKDALEIVTDTASDNNIKFSLSGFSLQGNEKDNLCCKAYELLKKDFEKIPPVKMHLHKNIPTGAGLGGGSADGAFTILLLNKKYQLGLSEEVMIRYALELGSDCPFFIKNKPCYATGRGEKLEEIQINLTDYQIILVNPGIHVNTKQAFAEIKPSQDRQTLKEIIQLPISEWKDHLKNDFEQTIFNTHPAIAEIKEKFYQQGAIYASMSGSGSTVYGLFEKSAHPVLDFPPHFLLHEL